MLRRALMLIFVGLSACVYLRAQPIGAIANPALVELSGLARSEDTVDWLWGHNDSGDSPRLFRVGLNGEDGGVVPVIGAAAEDWEDISSFTWQGAPALLIGDIGDNTASRDHITLYAVADPGRSATETKVLWKLQLRYPDGRFDAEGLAVDPITHDILILTKRQRPERIYRVAMPTAQTASVKDAEPIVAELIGPVLNIPKPTAQDIGDDPKFGWVRDWATALDIAPDGSFAVVVTYKNAYLYRRTPEQSWQASFAQKPELIRLPVFRQTEAAAIGRTGTSLYVGSEQRAGFIEVPLP